MELEPPLDFGGINPVSGFKQNVTTAPVPVKMLGLPFHPCSQCLHLLSHAAFCYYLPNCRKKNIQLFLKRDMHPYSHRVLASVGAVSGRARRSTCRSWTTMRNTRCPTSSQPPPHSPGPPKNPGRLWRYARRKSFSSGVGLCL